MLRFSVLRPWLLLAASVFGLAEGPVAIQNDSGATWWLFLPPFSAGKAFLGATGAQPATEVRLPQSGTPVVALPPGNTFQLDLANERAASSHASIILFDHAWCNPCGLILEMGWQAAPAPHHSLSYHFSRQAEAHSGRLPGLFPDAATFRIMEGAYAEVGSAAAQSSAPRATYDWIIKERTAPVVFTMEDFVSTTLEVMQAGSSLSAASSAQASSTPPRALPPTPPPALSQSSSGAAAPWWPALPDPLAWPDPFPDWTSPLLPMPEGDFSLLPAEASSDFLRSPAPRSSAVAEGAMKRHAHKRPAQADLEEDTHFNLFNLEEEPASQGKDQRSVRQRTLPPVPSFSETPQASFSSAPAPTAPRPAPSMHPQVTIGNASSEPVSLLIMTATPSINFQVASDQELPSHGRIAAGKASTMVLAPTALATLISEQAQPPFSVSFFLAVPDGEGGTDGLTFRWREDPLAGMANLSSQTLVQVTEAGEQAFSQARTPRIDWDQAARKITVQPAARP